MRKVSIFIIAIIIAACQGNRNNEKEAKQTANGKAEDITLTDFQSEEYHFTISYPQKWSSEEAMEGNRQTIINFFPEEDRTATAFPIIIHAPGQMTFIGIYPDGYGTELPMGRSEKLTSADIPLSFDIDMEDSKKFLLENGTEWGFFIVPENAPSSWSEHGFIFAQVGVKDFTTRCFDKESGEELNMKECNPMMGDTIKRYGKVKEDDANRLKQILGSIRFSATDKQKNSKQKFVDEIRVEHPQRNAIINSPLQIRGEVRGSWFFEAEFTVELKHNDETIAEAIAKAEGKWMTSDFVPFTANMEFNKAPSGEKAHLLFKNSNASGLPRYDKSYRLPVVLGKN